MRVFIAEKPSLGRAIASSLPSPVMYEKGYIRAANGDIVTWAVGHVLALAEPHIYDSLYKKWRLEDLPIIPKTWQWVIKPETKTQFAVIKKLIKEADIIVNAGDPDRCGQRLIDEILEYLNVKKPVKRVLINDLEKSAVKHALSTMTDNADYRLLSLSELARELLDWLHGINLSRLYTLHGKQKGHQGVLSVGRVQTPVLGLIVRRDQGIENFKPIPHFDISVRFTIPTSRHSSTVASTLSFDGKWQKLNSDNEQVKAGLDESGYLLDKSIARAVLLNVLKDTPQVEKVERRKNKVKPPLPYSLSQLQIDAANRLHLSASAVLTACQILYEKHQLITYPRSDCSYLPLAHHEMASKIVSNIAKVFPQAASIALTRLDQQTLAWNDQKVSAHHAIVPTIRELADLSHLNAAEREIYQLICLRYLAQFYPDFETEELLITVSSAGELWRISDKQITNLGWRRLYTKDKGSINLDNSPSQLARLKQGDELAIEKASIIDKKTMPPARFSDATLLSAMLNIANFVHDPALKQTLRDTDGLGTEATRAGIIETLFKRGFLKRDGKSIVSTDLGRELIAMLPEIAITPDLTAQFESNIEKVKQGELTFEYVVEQYQERLRQLINQVKSEG